MLMLEIEYLSYICQAGLTVSNQLLKAYNLYSEPNNEKNSFCYIESIQRKKRLK